MMKRIFIPEHRILTHLTSVKLKAFLGKSAPIPLSGEYWTFGADEEIIDLNVYGNIRDICILKTDIPKYALHDILSRPFCEALNKKIGRPLLSPNWSNKTRVSYLYTILSNANFKGGFPAVEVEINRLIMEK